MAEATVAEDQQVVVFALAEEQYGVDIGSVREIIRHQEITFVPDSPPAILGVTNLRGNVIPVVDLRTRLGMPAEPVTGASRIVVVDIHGDNVGVVVDAVDEVLRLSTEAIEPPPSLSSTSDSTYISGIARIDDRLMILLDVDETLSAEALANMNYVAPPRAAVAATGAEAERPEAGAAAGDQSSAEDAAEEPSGAEDEAEQPSEPDGPTLDDLNIELLESTFAAVAARGEELTAYFYDRLFEQHPGVRVFFEEANMQEQRGKLFTTLATVMASLRKPDELVPYLQRLGERHLEHGTRPEHYPVVGDVLLQSLAHIAGDAWTEEAKQAWTDAYTVSSNIMIAAAEAVREEQAA